MDGTLGLTKEALIAFKFKQEQAFSQNKEILFNLVFDEMSINKLIERTGT